MKKSQITITVPGILIQDRVEDITYYFAPNELADYLLTPGTDLSNAVEFYLPGDGLIDEVEEDLEKNVSDKPDVLVRNSMTNEAFFISHEELKKHRQSADNIKRLEALHISFVLPTGSDLIERAPKMRPAMLQSGTEMWD